MKIRFHKWAAAAATLFALAAGLLVLHLVTPSAYGIERVVAAYNKIRSVHVRTSRPQCDATNEFWIQSDPAGQVIRARYYLPATEDGAKLVTWTPQRTELWFQKKHGFLLYQTKRIAPWMQSYLDQCQPQLVLEKVVEEQKAGKINVQINDRRDASQAQTIVVTHKDTPDQKIFYIDPKSDLITRIESYKVTNSVQALVSTTDFGEYNAAFDDSLFSLREQLPPGVWIADQIHQLIGLPQENRTDEQAAQETVRRFFQALIDKDYKQAGLYVGGEIEDSMRAQFSQITVLSIESLGKAEAQPDWVPHGFKVPCKVSLASTNDTKTTWETGAYVRPGDDEMHPDRWNITGGVFPGQSPILPTLPDNEKYAKLTPKEAAAALFKTFAESNWTELLKFWPLPESDPNLETMKDYYGGLQLISLGEPFQTNDYSGWYVPYEIKLPPNEVNVRVSSDNPARRFVILGTYDRKLKPVEELKWPASPEALSADDPDTALSAPDMVRAYFAAIAKKDWTEMRKFAPESDVQQTQREIANAEKRGLDLTQQIPVVEEGPAYWSAQKSVWFVKCTVPARIKKHNLAVRNDNSAHRFLWDGGL